MANITEMDGASTAHGQGRSPRLATLDSIRGVAALVVVVHHCLLTQPAFSDFFFSNWRTPATGTVEFMLFHTPLRIVWDGYEAVTLFYVLSGLVLALPWIEGRPPTYRTYAIKRVCRIYLPYCAIIVVAAGLNSLLRPVTEVPGLSAWVNTMTWSTPVTPWSLMDHALMIGHYMTINGAVHSLIWEMRVSLLFPLLMLPLIRWRAWGAVASVVGLAGLVVGIQFALASSGGGDSMLHSATDVGAMGELALEVRRTAYYAIFFVLGALLTLYLTAIRRWLARTAPYGGVACLVAGLFVIQAHWTQVRQAQEMFVALGSALVIIGALAPGSIETALSHRSLRFLGRISYSLYLVHVPLILASVLLLDGVLPIGVVLVCVPPVAIILGWLFHETVAEPCVRLGQRLALRTTRHLTTTSVELTQPVTS